MGISLILFYFICCCIGTYKFIKDKNAFSSKYVGVNILLIAASWTMLLLMILSKILK